jgi:hypothetical protein
MKLLGRHTLSMFSAERTMKKLGILFIALLLVSTAGGCSWVGRTAGKTQAKVERKAQELERGYHQGYAEEQGKKHSPDANSGVDRGSGTSSGADGGQPPPQTDSNRAGQSPVASSEQQAAE